MKKTLGTFLTLALAGICLADRTISENLTLTEDTDWRGDGTVTIAQGVAVELAGHSLTMDGLAGSGMILNTFAPANGYELLESLTATGTQYIDLALAGASGIRVDADFSVVDDAGNYVMLGAEMDKIIPLWISGSKWYAGYSWNAGGSVAYVSNTRMQVTSWLSNGSQLVMGNGATLVTGSATGNYSTGENSLYVFARNSYSTNVISQTSGTLYSMRIWQSGTLVRDLRPARRTADDALGLLDLLDGTFYTNSGTGSFTAGPAVTAPANATAASVSFTTDIACTTWGRIAFGANITRIRRAVFPDGAPTPGDRLISWTSIPAVASEWQFDDAPDGVTPVITMIGLYYGLGTNSSYSCTWKGGDGVFNAYTNWTKGASETMTQFAGQMCYLPENPGRTDTFSYDGTTLMQLYTSPLWVYGNYAFSDEGGFYASSLTLFGTSRIIYDPVSFTFRLRRPPDIRAGAKFALPAKYAAYTKGRFLLLTWNSGTLSAETTAALASFFDTTSSAATQARVTAETFGTGGRLWLELAPDTARMRLNVFTSGDSITQGSDSNWGNWRTFLMKRLEAEGYDVMAKGHWCVDSADICGAAMPSNWIWHSGIGSQALITTSGRYGLCDCMENLLNTAGDLDLMLLLIGTNNLNHDSSQATDLYPHWTNLVTRMLAQKPHAKLIVGAVTNQGMWPIKEAQVQAFNTLMSNAVANAVFPAKRVYFADLHSATPRYDADGNYIAGSYLAADNVHPHWPSEDKMAAVWCDAIQRALADDPDWQGGVAETNPTTTGAEVNVPAAYREGFVRARTLDVAAHNHTPYSTLGGVPYEDATGCTAATQNISRVGYYLEIRPKNTYFNDYRGLVRYLWVDMDAFGTCTLDAVGVPYAEENVCRTTRLHVKTNMPGIEETPPTDDSRTAWIEFSPRNYSATASGRAGAPAKVGPGRDWNDTPYGTAPGYGAMQVHRFTPGAYNPAEVLFCFNAWGTSDDTFGQNFGMGNLGIQQAGCLDWTLYATGGTKVPLYSIDAYEVARIEIWTKSFADDANPYPPHVALTSMEYVDGAYTFVGAYQEPGTGGSNITVRIEWSDTADFAAVVGTQTLGAYNAAAALTGAVSGLDATVARYFRLVATNERNISGTSEVIEMDPQSTVVTRATWTGAAGNGLATDAGNWSCRNAMNNLVANGIPGTVTKIASCTLAGDCDWRGIDAEIDGTIDLFGHRLQVSTLRGTGTITDSTLLAGYQRLESIRATGTQYLDSGVYANTSSGLYAEADFMVHDAGGNYVILGACTSSQNCVLMWVSGSKWYMSYATHLGGTMAYGADARHYVCSTMKNGTQRCVVDGEVKVSGTNTGNLTFSRTLYILARNNNGGVNSQAQATLYSMKIWNGGTLVRDYVPAKRMSDGAAGLFDRVNLTFTGNKGSGAFTEGEVETAGGAAGELVIDVAADAAVTNTTVTLTGHFKFVKTGAGTFVAAKAGQDYYGGNQAQAGKLAFGSSTQAKLFGRPRETFDIESGAVLDFAGSVQAYPYSFVLNGGTLSNSVAQNEVAGIEKLSVTADSFVSFDKVYNFRPGSASSSTVDLGGHTLTFSGIDRWYGVNVTRGTLRYLEGSLCHPKPHYTLNAPEVTLDMNGAFLPEDDVVVVISNYVARSEVGWYGDTYKGTVKLFGTFTPVVDEFWGCVMQDGARIDLTDRAGAWHTTSSTAIGLASKATVTFADNAHIGLVLGARARTCTGYVVTWDEPPTNVDTLVFEAIPASTGTKVIVDNEGIRLYRSPTIIILR